MALNIRISKPSEEPDLVRVGLGGRLDQITAPELERSLVSVLEGSARPVAFELCDLTFITSAGIRLFLATHKQLATKGGTILVQNPQPQVAKILGMAMALPDPVAFSDGTGLDRHISSVQRKPAGGEPGASPTR